MALITGSSTGIGKAGVMGLGFRVMGIGFWLHGLGFGGMGLYRLQSSGFRDLMGFWHG